MTVLVFISEVVKAYTESDPVFEFDDRSYKVGETDKESQILQFISDNVNRGTIRIKGEKGEKA